MKLDWDGDPLDFESGDVLWFARIGTNVIDLEETQDGWRAHVHTRSDLDLYGCGANAQAALNDVQSKAVDSMQEIMALMGYENV